MVWLCFLCPLHFFLAQRVLLGYRHEFHQKSFFHLILLFQRTFFPSMCSQHLNTCFRWCVVNKFCFRFVTKKKRDEWKELKRWEKSSTSKQPSTVSYKMCSKWKNRVKKDSMKMSSERGKKGIYHLFHCSSFNATPTEIQSLNLSLF